ncbi:MAG: tripartite tricarboxylate transporter permease [Deinococcota bacterium]|nr:tripartite tricarboxylate transporter permease [Deinococcota bacterium]
MLDSMLAGFTTALQWQNVLVAFAGAVLGIIVGATPGISATLGIALLVPVTFAFTPTTALIMLGGVYCGAIYGGSIAAILIRVPGTPAAVAVLEDGYEMTRQGRAGHALGADIISSLVGGQIGVLLLLFFAPFVAAWALNFRSAEFFWIVVFAMTTIGAFTQGAVIKGLLAGALGLLLATIGTHPVSGELRYTFGQLALFDGLPVIVALIGLFSVSQALYIVEEIKTGATPLVPKIGPMWPGFKPLWKLRATFLRSSFIGSFIGILPGAGADIASFIAHSEAKRFSKNPQEFGKGSMEGIIAGESANNAVVGGSLIPLLTLGIPGNAVTAALLGGLLIHGLIPGPRLFEQQSTLLYTFIFSLFLANIFFAVAGFVGLRYVAKVVLTPQGVLAPLIIVLSVIGAYAFRNSLTDIWIVLALGVLGYILRKLSFPLAPILLGLILGPIAEENLARASNLATARGMSTIEYLLSSPISMVFFGLSIASIAYSIYQDRKWRPAQDGSAGDG